MHPSIPASQCNTQIGKFKGGRGKRVEGGGGKERRRVQERECLVYVFFCPSPGLSLLTNQPFPRNEAQINRLASEHSQNLLGSQNIQRGQINSPFSVCLPHNTPASHVKLVIIQGDKKNGPPRQIGRELLSEALPVLEGLPAPSSHFYFSLKPHTFYFFSQL